jgi:hypothetical protein
MADISRSKTSASGGLMVRDVLQFVAGLFKAKNISPVAYFRFALQTSVASKPLL